MVTMRKRAAGWGRSPVAASTAGVAKPAPALMLRAGWSACLPANPVNTPWLADTSPSALQFGIAAGTVGLITTLEAASKWPPLVTVASGLFFGAAVIRSGGTLQKCCAQEHLCLLSESLSRLALLLCCGPCRLHNGHSAQLAQLHAAGEAAPSWILQLPASACAPIHLPYVMCPIVARARTTPTLSTYRMSASIRYPPLQPCGWCSSNMARTWMTWSSQWRRSSAVWQRLRTKRWGGGWSNGCLASVAGKGGEKGWPQRIRKSG